MLREGFIAALAAFLIWGAMPAYYRLLLHVDAGEILAHRILWSLPFLFLLVWGFNKFADVRHALSSLRNVGALAGTTLLVTLNWFVFVYAVVNDKILATSLGYYINPLVSVLLGVALLGERLSKIQKLAVGLAALGVLNQIFAVGEFPWIALTLAFSFGFYGYFRKTQKTDAISGHFIEVLLITPFVLFAVLWFETNGPGRLANWSDRTGLFLILSGPITFAPLVLFTLGARRLNLSTIGLLQYIAPSMSLLLGLAYGEPFTLRHLATFAFIWAALALYSSDLWKRDRAARRMRVAPAQAVVASGPREASEDLAPISEQDSAKT